MMLKITLHYIFTADLH